MFRTSVVVRGLVCSGAAKLFVDFIAAPYEKQEITTDAKSFYLQEKALKEKLHKEEQERLAAEKPTAIPMRTMMMPIC